MGIWKMVANTTQKTLRRGGKVLLYAGTHPKKSFFIGAGTYAGWQYLFRDRPLVESAGDIAGKAADITFGEDRVDKAVDVTKDTAASVKDKLDAAGEKISNATSAITGAANGAREATGALTGVGNFLNGLTTGNGIGMLGDFFRNLATGRVGGLGIAGMIAAAILCFGRFGFIGKIIGGMLAMMTIGNNMRPSVRQLESLNTLQPSPGQSPSPTVTQQPVEEPVKTIHRGR